MADDRESILRSIDTIESRLKEIDSERKHLYNNLSRLRLDLARIENTPKSSAFEKSGITALSPLRDKIALFRSLFRGREDVYPKLWVSKKTGAQGYSPVCGNEWIAGVCRKPTIKCGECSNRKLLLISDDVIRKHLEGSITIGAYPMLQDETCRFLAIDFDKESWQEDVKAFAQTCRTKHIPASLERSRSGNGGHVWIFFSEPVAASLARQLGTFLITETMADWHELDMKSYDR